MSEGENDEAKFYQDELTRLLELADPEAPEFSIIGNLDPVVLSKAGGLEKFLGDQISAYMKSLGKLSDEVAELVKTNKIDPLIRTLEFVKSNKS